MKTMKTICLTLLVLTAALSGARGIGISTNINPALLYYQAFIVAPEPMSAADESYLSSKKGREQKLPERFGKILAGYDSQFRMVHLAAYSKVPCDWGVEVSDGPNSMLPHLARAKAVCRTAQLRALWALQHGRQAEARDELLAAFVLGRNAGSDELLISVCVQCAIEGLDYGTVAQNFGEFSTETLKELVAGFEAAPPRHTMAACVPSERELSRWLETKLLDLQRAHPHDDAKVLAEYRHSGLALAMEAAGFRDFWPKLMAASGGTSEGVLKLVREAEPLFPRVAEIMALPEPEYEVQAKQFVADHPVSPNPFLAMLDALFDGLVLGQQRFPLRPREFRAQAQLAMVHAALQYKLHGESGVKGVTDPFGNGPFGYRRFVFKGVDRGFELKSAYAGADAPFVMIFVEKQGPAFEVIGPDVGKAIEK
jgi:hypothetical protein